MVTIISVAQDAPTELIISPGCKVIIKTAIYAADMRWTGACKDGYADGDGQLLLSTQDEDTVMFYRGRLTQGLFSGEGELVYENKAKRFNGNFSNGLFNGKGTLVNSFSTFNGTFKNGLKEVVTIS